MIRNPDSHSVAHEDEVRTPRIFLREPGWRVGLKATSEREFCHQIHPGEDHHHRLGQGEIFVFQGDERLCLPCAERRGLISFEPKPLRQPVLAAPVPPEADDDSGTIPVLDRHGVSPEDEHEPPMLRE